MGGFAWVTLATNDSYSLGALVLAHSLKRVNTAHELVILITPGVSEAMRTQLSAAFNLVKLVDVLDSRDTANLALLARPELGITFTKLHCWRLTQYEKCVFLDADTIVIQNSDELFEREELSAAPDVGWPDCFNSGVFVYKPSEETFKSISDFAIIHGTFDGGDQGLLNLYFSDWATKDIKKHLPFVYNVVSSVTYSYLPALKQFQDKLKIIHFIGATKPWLQPFDTETGLSRISGDVQSQSQGAFIQLWWDIFCAHVHPILSSTMAGLAAALSTITLGSPLAVEQSALQQHLRRQGWEEGHIDYMGRDSFDNIWLKICETLASGPSQVPTSQPFPQTIVEPSSAPPTEQSKSIERSPPKETKLEARRASVPQAEKPVSTVVLTPKTIVQSTVETPIPTTPPIKAPSEAAVPELPTTQPDTIPITDVAPPSIPSTEPVVCPLVKSTETSTTTSVPVAPPTCSLPKPSEQAAPPPPTEAAVSPLPKALDSTVPPLAELATCPLTKPSEPAVPPPDELTSCPLPKPLEPAVTPSEPPSCPLPQPSKPAVPTPSEPQSCPLPQPSEQIVPTPSEPPVCSLPKPSEPPVPPTESTACPLPKPSEPPVQPTESTACPLPKPSEPPVPPTETTACPLQKPSQPPPVSPSTEAAICSLSKPTEPPISTQVPDPVICPLPKPIEPVVPTPQSEKKPAETSSTQLTTDSKTESPPQSQPQAQIKTEPIKPESVQIPPTSAEKHDSSASDSPSCPLVKPALQPDVPLAPSVTSPTQTTPSQPSTPTITSPTPPVSPPAIQSETPISLTEKLSIEVEIPQTPPAVSAPSGATGGDEPPIPPKRKGGKGAAAAEQQGKQGKGGKGGKGKK